MHSSKGQAWFCTTGLPSDIVVDVADMTFHLHKFPLISRSRKLHEMITEQESAGEHRDPQSSSAVNDRNGDEDEDAEEADEHQCQISFREFPGSSETFEAVAKFCYGVKIELSSSNVAPLRCAAEFLEMTDEYSEGNLISKTEMFLSQSTLKSGKECLKALKSCEKLMPLAEELNIVEKCVDSFVSRVGSADLGLFGWPVVDAGNDSRVSNQDRRKGNKTLDRTECWLQDLAYLGLPMFKQLILGMRVKEVSSEIIENCLIFYAKKYIPGISRSSRMSASSPAHSVSQNEQRELLETVVTNLPLKRSSRFSPVSRYLFGLLRTANILNATESCRSVLEKKIGFMLDQATLDDLLIPSYSYLNETLYDIECVERILRYFLESLERRSSGAIEEDEKEEGEEDMLPALMTVGKLIDGYLSEIASDANLKPDKFIDLAVLLPEQSRVFDDGLYRAVDVYLKAHPWLPEVEREKICGIMDCQKLTLDACTHAAQNERLPLRAVVQVLFFEQLQLRQAIAGSLIAAEGMPSGHLRAADEYGGDDNNEVDIGGVIVAQSSPAARSTWKAAVRENQVLRLDMDSMRTRVHQLEHECSSMKKVIEKIDKTDPSESKGWKGSLSKKLGCKFKTQVCDSHEPNVVDTRRSRRNRQ
uniref:Phototropic-responsive NPH3 family protein n=1 Tax=Kalanchoe fedtschenkoi TaxID=63787 RepID=A0A7N0UBZ2_KALFE